MPVFALPFPVIDPVAIAVGPFAIRWYALAYILGITLGWLYARALIRATKPWGGPAPMSVLQFDDFVLWVTLGIILGGRIGYVLFYNLPYFAAHPLEAFEVWKGGMSFHGGFTGCVLAVLLFGRNRGIPVLSLGDITCAVGPIGIFLGRIANFINAELWGRTTDVPGEWCFPQVVHCQDTRVSFTKPRWKVSCCSWRLRSWSGRARCGVRGRSSGLSLSSTVWRVSPPRCFASPIRNSAFSMAE